MEKESYETASQAERQNGRVAISAKSSGPLRFVEFALRALALGSTMAAAIVMGKNKQTLSVLAVAKYSYSPAFVFFVIANAIACGYAFFSVPISLLRPQSFAAIKFLIFFLDLVMVALVTAGASAATAIAYVGHKGNSHTMWSPICGLFGRFCNHVGGALVSSFIGVIIFMVLTVISTLSLYKHRR